VLQRSFPRPSLRSWRATPVLNEPLTAAKPAGQWLVLFGLAAVLSAKGCDATFARRAASLDARAERTRLEAEYDYDREEARLNNRLEKIRNTPAADRSPADNEELESLQEELSDLAEARRQEMQELRSGRLMQYEFAARRAKISLREWGLHTERLFSFGTLLFGAGLLIVGFTGTSAHRWLCLAMLAILIFSIYVGGLAWAASFAGIARSSL
jgi:hypothetical protein